MNAPRPDPYAPPSSPLLRSEPPAIAPRYERAERAVMVILVVLMARVGIRYGVAVRAGAPFEVFGVLAIYQLGLPATALLLVWQGKHLGYLLSLTAGSMFMSLSLPVLLSSRFSGGAEFALSFALWPLSWYAARGRFGYLFKPPRRRPRSSARRGPDPR